MVVMARKLKHTVEEHIAEVLDSWRDFGDFSS